MANRELTTKQDKEQEVNIPTRDFANKAFDLLPISQNTRNTYKRTIGSFIAYMQVTGLNQYTIANYRNILADHTEWSVSTKNAYLASAKRLAGVMYTQGLIPVDITKDISGKDIKGFKQDKKHKKDGLTESEVTRLGDYLNNLPKDDLEAIRLRAMVALLIYQGLRQIELARLDVTDLDLTRGKALILGKGRQDKEQISLHPHAVDALKRYLKAFNLKSGALFTSESNHARGSRLTTRSINRIISDLFRELGINNTVHATRHYFTTAMIKNYGGDLLAVTHYTRHKSLEMLTVYNDAINAEKDLPRYVSTFRGVTI